MLFYRLSFSFLTSGNWAQEFGPKLNIVLENNYVPRPYFLWGPTKTYWTWNCGVHAKRNTHARNRRIPPRIVFTYKYNDQRRLAAQKVPAQQIVNNTTKLLVLTITHGSSYTFCQFYLRVFNQINISVFYKPYHLSWYVSLIED